DGIFVDGYDVFAVYQVTKHSLEKARAGGGPTMIECYTYRMSDHTTADDASKYRDPKEVEEWKKKDPIDRLKKFLMKKKFLTEQEDKKIWEDARARVLKEVEIAEKLPAQDPLEIFNYVYGQITPRLMEQREEMKESSKVQIPKEVSKGIGNSF